MAETMIMAGDRLTAVLNPEGRKGWRTLKCVSAFAEGRRKLAARPNPYHYRKQARVPYVTVARVSPYLGRATRLDRHVAFLYYSF